MCFKLLLIIAGIILSARGTSQNNIFLIDGTEIQADSIKIFKSSITYFVYNNKSLISKSIQKSLIDSIATQYQKTEIFKPQQNLPSKSKVVDEENKIGDQLNLRIQKGGLTTRYFSDQGMISAREFNKLFSTNTEAHRLYKKGRHQINASNIIGFPSGFIVGYQLGKAVRGRGINKKWLYGGLLTSLISISLGSRGSKKINQAINDFNASKDNSLGIQLGVGGARLTYTF